MRHKAIFAFAFALLFVVTIEEEITFEDDLEDTGKGFPVIVIPCGKDPRIKYIKTEITPKEFIKDEDLLIRIIATAREEVQVKSFKNRLTLNKELITEETIPYSRHLTPGMKAFQDYALHYPTFMPSGTLELDLIFLDENDVELVCQKILIEVY